jgi:O-antigen ligase
MLGQVAPPAIGRGGAALTTLGTLLAVIALWALPFGASETLMLALVALGLAALAYLAWYADPAWLFTAALLASTFSSNWDAFHLPAGVAPDRLILLAGMAAVLFRSAGAARRPALQGRPLYLLFALTLLYAIGSAVAAGTLSDADTRFTLVDRFGVPFVVFILSPLVFRTEAQRRIFLGSLVVFGAYLGLTTLFQTIGPRALVIPSFILDPHVGASLQVERGRGPFLQAAVNGMGLYVCGVCAAIAIATWKRRLARLGSGAVMVLCTLGLLFTLTRSVWVASIVATSVTLVATAGLRRFLIPAAAGAAVLILGALALAPGFDARFEQRSSAQRSVWERRNLNAAGLEMVSQRPLVGFGLGTFNERNAEYFPLLDEYPQVADQQLGIHNAFLSLATELGLIGLALYVLSFCGATGAALLSRGPPALRHWRTGLLAIVIFWVIVSNFSPFTQVFPTLITWLWAGIVLGGSRFGDQGGSAYRPQHEAAAAR